MGKRMGPKTRIRSAMAFVQREISNSATGSVVARGLSGEGYAGGYAQALRDVLLVLDDVQPRTRGYWRDFFAVTPGAPDRSQL